MKKLAVAILSAAFILGAGTAVFAAGNSNGDFSFDKMLPFMQKMHPNVSKEDLKDMYKACHKNGGMMGDTDKDQMNNMMNRY
jgi:hypothetical protein